MNVGNSELLSQVETIVAKTVKQELLRDRRLNNVKDRVLIPNRYQYSKKEAAILLCCSEDWLRTLEKDYGLRRTMKGTKVFYLASELKRFVEQDSSNEIKKMVQKGKFDSGEVSDLSS
ncbi:MAG: hypothetical protein COA78_32520 [Blastopirellula sp.]|nr:MAG: hypothetical protein COA78_32520 [Blastopirellula sp.]